MNDELNQTAAPLPQEQPAPVAPTPKKDSFFTEIFKFVFFTLIIVLPIRFFIAQPFIVSGASMDPTFETGQYLIVDQLSYHLGSPERGQVIIFKYPKDTSKYFIKRVIGLPGETVIIDGTKVTIKNKQHPNGFTLNEPYIDSRNQAEGAETITLPSNQYFVMGDNRRQSSDSRAWGTVPRSDIIGTPFLRLFPFDKIGVEPGYYKESQ
jgi:signal peptidase I